MSWEGIPSEMLTIRQQICHVRDIEIDGYIQRFESLLHEDDPFLPSIDGYALVETRRYDQTDIGTALDAFDRGRSRTMKLLDATAPVDLARSGTFEGYGPVTVQSVIHFLSTPDLRLGANLKLGAKFRVKDGLTCDDMTPPFHQTHGHVWPTALGSDLLSLLHRA